jgi:hypothetical protein
MKSMNLILISLTLLCICSCEENAPDASNNNTDFKEELREYLSSLRGVKTLNREELRDVFISIFKIVRKGSDQVNNETNIHTLETFADNLFNDLADKEQNVIIMEEVLKKFNPKAINDYLVEFLKELDLKQILYTLFKVFVRFLGELISEMLKTTDL